MVTLRTYRHFITAFLLAVYGFIATPVQLWHHHHSIVKATPATVSPDSKSSYLSQGSIAPSDANCQICCHKYSSYNNDALIVFETAPVATAAKNGCYTQHFISAATFLLPNKGPPALC